MYGKSMKLALDASLLAFECQQVIGLSFLKLTLEANRMAAEKSGVWRRGSAGRTLSG